MKPINGLLILCALFASAPTGAIELSIAARRGGLIPADSGPVLEIQIALFNISQS
ncbi:MAG: hypothetical protein R3E53_07875 [Myxococcota bacterium]